MSAPRYELAIERVLDAPLDTVWRAATDHIAQWWCPRPWTTKVVALDWRAGGRFALTMHGPDGEEQAGDGMVLEYAPRERIVFTNMLGEGWLPQQARPMGIVGTFAFADAGGGRTHYRASALHWNEADRRAHDEMGFAEGWGICADQLEAVAQKLWEDGDA